MFHRFHHTFAPISHLLYSSFFLSLFVCRRLFLWWSRILLFWKSIRSKAWYFNFQGRKQTIDFDICKRNLILKLQKELDKSKKGSVDEPIVELVDYINQTKDFCTTSSCSGRFAIFCAAYSEERGEQISVTRFSVIL